MFKAFDYWEELFLCLFSSIPSSFLFSFTVTEVFPTLQWLILGKHHAGSHRDPIPLKRDIL